MAIGLAEDELPAEVERSNDVNGEPMFTSADLRAARRRQPDLGDHDEQTEAVEPKGGAQFGGQK